DVVEHTGRDSEHGAAIAAICRMTHAVRRLAREEYRLVDVCCDGAPAEMSRERTMTHEHDVIRVRLLFSARSTTFDVATVVMHADDRTLVQRPKRNFFIGLSHKCYRTNPSSIREIRG